MISPRLGFDSSWKCKTKENAKICSKVDRRAREVFQNGQGCVGRRTRGLIGRGMCGVALETTCGNDDQYVTKTIKLGQCYSVEKFYREVWAQNMASTVGVAPKIVESYVTDKEAVIVMERVFGQTVDTVNQRNVSSVKSEKSLIGKAARLAKEIGKSLTALHSLKIVHGDSHIQNMIVDERTGRVKLIDFGRVRFVGLDDTDTEEDIRAMNRDYTWAVQTFLHDYPQYERAQVKAIEPFLKKDVDTLKKAQGKNGKTAKKKTVRKTRK